MLYGRSAPVGVVRFGFGAFFGDGKRADEHFNNITKGRKFLCSRKKNVSRCFLRAVREAVFIR